MGILYVDPIHTVRVAGTKAVEFDVNLVAQTPGNNAQKETVVEGFLTQTMASKEIIRVALFHIFELSPLNYLLRIAPEGYIAPPNWWEDPPATIILPKEP